MTIRLLALLLERPLVQLLQAERADEVFWMELPEHGGDASAGDGLVAAGAQRAPERVEVGLAVGPALVLEEVAVGEGSTASYADETAWKYKGKSVKHIQNIRVKVS